MSSHDMVQDCKYVYFPFSWNEPPSPCKHHAAAYLETRLKPRKLSKERYYPPPLPPPPPAVAVASSNEPKSRHSYPPMCKNMAERFACRKRITQASSSMATAPSLGPHILVPECQSKVLNAAYSAMDTNARMFDEGNKARNGHQDGGNDVPAHLSDEESFNMLRCPSMSAS